MKLLVFFIFIVVFLLRSSSAFGESTFAGDLKEVVKKNNIIEIKLSHGMLSIYVLESNIIRFRYTGREEFLKNPSYGVIWKGSEKTEVSFTEKENSCEVVTEELKILITKNPCRISIYNKEGNMINQDDPSFGVSFDGPEVRCYKKLFVDEMFFGLGEKTGFLNKRGSQYTMWNSDNPAYSKNQDPLYESIPFFIGVREKGSYGIYLDNTYKSYFNMGAGQDRFYWFGADGGEMDYYFIYGPEIKRVISSYTFLTGRMELPPLWALGYQQSRWSYYPDWKVISIAQNFRDRQIPCDVIYLDIDYMDGYRVFTWDKERFPDPKKLISDLKNRGFKIVPIIDPGVKADDNYTVAKEGIEKDLFVKYPDGTLYKGEVWPSWAYFPDFTKEETRKWWAEKVESLMDIGIEGIWNDMNEPSVWGRHVPDIVRFDDRGYGADHKKIHNVFALEMAEATFNAFQDKGKRPFILTRAGFSGIQRYAAVWTGDNVSNETHLIMACLMPQGMGLSGMTFVGSDVGGFEGYPSKNLYVRWMQLGAFTPFFRGHSCIGMEAKEPWALGDDVEVYTREAIKLRYKFLPCLYNEFYNATKTGLPVMRPLFLNYQNDNECYKEEAQKEFIIGENLLVAPVLSENDMFKKLYLPEGRWLSLRDKKIYEGKEWIVIEVPISEIPVFIREGGIIPLQVSQNYVGEKEITEYEFKIFPGEYSTYDLYEDDGISFKYKEGIYSITEIEVKKAEHRVEISVTKPYKKYESKKKDYFFEVYDIKEPSEVTLSGKTLKRSDKSDMKEEEGYFFKDEEDLLIVKIKDASEFTLNIKG
ncbi:MAG TPA: glycoside hydrolase family 31 protein [Candidatus Eremiobacteraeota bacterium]|nr:MAG: Alpha-xylosidase [bacterium ADurb.Bin363]HPZ09099.1 glycoside hydrolase family 31 protein [Candidatus Eremiobacteraeota bacterium]